MWSGRSSNGPSRPSRPKAPPQPEEKTVEVHAHSWEIGFWRSRLGATRWVLFENGTVVVLKTGRSLDELANSAIAVISNLGDRERPKAHPTEASSGHKHGWIIGPFPSESGVYVFVNRSEAGSADAAVAEAQKKICEDKDAFRIVTVSA